MREFKIGDRIEIFDDGAMYCSLNKRIIEDFGLKNYQGGYGASFSLSGFTGTITTILPLDENDHPKYGIELANGHSVIFGGTGGSFKLLSPKITLDEDLFTL